MLDRLICWLVLSSFLSGSCYMECEDKLNQSSCCVEPTGYKFKAMLFDKSQEGKDAFFDELIEPFPFSKSDCNPFLSKCSENITSMILIKLKIVNRGQVR